MTEFDKEWYEAALEAARNGQTAAMEQADVWKDMWIQQSVQFEESKHENEELRHSLFLSWVGFMISVGVYVLTLLF